jgi:hypothetical protein
VAELTHLDVKEIETTLIEEEASGPETGRLQVEIAPARMKMAWPKDTDQQQKRSDEEQVAHNDGDVDAVVGNF